MSAEARELAQRFGVRMCDENGMTHGEELYCLGLDDIIAMKEALAKQEQHTLSSRVNDVRVHIEHGKQHDEAMKRITAKQEQGEPVAYIHRNEYNEYRLEPHDDFDIKSIPFNVDVPLFKSSQGEWVKLMRGVRVEGDTVVISVKGGNEAARELCGELINEMTK